MDRQNIRGQNKFRIGVFIAVAYFGFVGVGVNMKEVSEEKKPVNCIHCGLGVSIEPTTEHRDGLNYDSYEIKNKEVGDDE